MPTPHADAAAALVVALIVEQLAFALYDEDGDGEGFALVGAQLCRVGFAADGRRLLCRSEDGAVLFEAPNVEELAAWLALQ